MTLHELKVLLALSSRADENGKCYPAIKTIADDAGIADPRAVQRALRGLEEGGIVLSFHRRDPDNQNEYRSNLYAIQPDPHVWLEEQRTEEEGPGGFVGSTAWTAIDGLLRDRPGLFVGVRARQYGERCELLDYAKRIMPTGESDDDGAIMAVDEALPLPDTPGIVLELNGNKSRFKDGDLRDAQRLLDTQIMWLCSDRLIPWSVLRCIIHTANENQKARSTPAVENTATPW